MPEGEESQQEKNHCREGIKAGDKSHQERNQSTLEITTEYE